jgi:hypothetical protein
MNSDLLLEKIFIELKEVNWNARNWSSI